MTTIKAGIGLMILTVFIVVIPEFAQSTCNFNQQWHDSCESKRIDFIYAGSSSTIALIGDYSANYRIFVS
jgi:hypothetical protein